MIPNKMGKEKKGRVNNGVEKSRKKTEIGSFFSNFYYFCAAQRIKSARLENFSTGTVFSHLKYNFQCSIAVERCDSGWLLASNQ